MALFIIRHGETAANAARVLQVPETPLSERGLGQAARLAERLSTDGVARILASDLARARMTAEAVSARTGVGIELDPGLQERSFGDLRGTPYADLGFDPFAPGYEPPNGESWSVFHDRVSAVFERIKRAVAETRGNLAVVTHGLVCRSLAERHLTLPDGMTVPVRWVNTSVTVVEHAPPYTVRRINCAEHLDAHQLDRDAPSGL